MSSPQDLAKEAVVNSAKAGLEEGKDALITQLEKKSFYNALVKGLNKSIDVPFVSETTEERIIKGILNVCIEALKEVDFNGED